MFHRISFVYFLILSTSTSAFISRFQADELLNDQDASISEIQENLNSNKPPLYPTIVSNHFTNMCRIVPDLSNIKLMAIINAYKSKDSQINPNQLKAIALYSTFPYCHDAHFNNPNFMGLKGIFVLNEIDYHSRDTSGQIIRFDNIKKTMPDWFVGFGPKSAWTQITEISPEWALLISLTKSKPIPGTFYTFNRNYGKGFRVKLSQSITNKNMVTVEGSHQIIEGFDILLPTGRAPTEQEAIQKIDQYIGYSDGFSLFQDMTDISEIFEEAYQKKNTALSEEPDLSDQNLRDMEAIIKRLSQPGEYKHEGTKKWIKKGRKKVQKKEEKKKKKASEVSNNQQVSGVYQTIPENSNILQIDPSLADCGLQNDLFPSGRTMEEFAEIDLPDSYPGNPNVDVPGIRQDDLEEDVQYT